MDIPKTSSPNPQNEYLNISKVAKYISTKQGLINTNEEISLQLTTIPKKNIFVTVNLFADENLSISNPNITLYDAAVMDAIYTLYVSGSEVFTPEMIVRTMSGNLTQDVTPQKAGAITKSLNKLTMVRITIDCTEELIARKVLKKGQKAHLKSYLMPLRELEVKLGNQKIAKGYQLIEEPVLYTYAEKVGQIINVPRSLLETKGELSDTDEVIIIKRQLIKRIEAMKNSKNHIVSRKISYEWYDKNTNTFKGFFIELGYKKNDYSNWRKKKSNLHHIIKTLLTNYAKEKYIKSFTETKEGNGINGIEITL